MRKRKRLQVIATITCLLLSAQLLQAQKTFATALQLNDYLIVPNDSMYSKGQAMGRSILEGIRTKDFTRFAESKKAISSYARTTIDELKKIPDQFGSEEFRKGVIDFLEYEIEFLRTKIPLMDKLNAKSTDDDISKAIEQLQQGSKEEETYLNVIREMQKRFAEKNGFIIGGAR